MLTHTTAAKRRCITGIQAMNQNEPARGKWMALTAALLGFLAALGMGGEWSLGVALVTEIWPDRSRAFLAGLIGAAANVGFLLIAVMGLGLGAMLEETRDALLSVGLPDAWVTGLLHNN